jgi:hypothetical protein
MLALAVAAPCPADSITPAAIAPTAITPAEMEPLRITQASLTTIRDGIAAWLQDQVSRPLSRAETGCDEPFDVTMIPAISHPVLEALLVPVYLDTLPELDGWGNPYELRLAVTDLLAPHVAVVRSAGANATFEGTVYSRADTTSLKQDLVVLDLSWLQRPGPALLDPRSRLVRAQREIAMMSTGMLSWVTDQVSRTGASLGEPVDLELFPPITAADLRSILIQSCTFFYVPYVPELDPWGHPYDYFLDVEDVLSFEVVAVRGRGRDGLAEGSVYETGVFPAYQLDRDTVLADGLEVRVPDDLAALIHLEDFESGDFRHWSAATS